jgi:hypothetical protein
MEQNKFFRYGFDVLFDKSKSKPFVIDNAWTVIDSDLYDKIYSAAIAFKAEPTDYLKNKDKIYFTSDTKGVLPQYKIDDYCNNKNIKTKTVTKLEDASLIIADIDNAIAPISYSSKSKCVLYPIKELIQYLDEESVKSNNVNVDEDVVIMSIDSLKEYNKYLDRKYATELLVNFNFVFSKQETEDQFVNFEPFQTLYQGIINNTPVISYKNFVIELHRNSSEIDEDMYDNLVKMFSSPDNENKVLAVNIIADANREKSLPELVVLYHKNQAQFSKAEANVQEFVNFMNEFIQYDTSETNIRTKLKDLGVPKTKIDKYLN